MHFCEGYTQLFMFCKYMFMPGVFYRGAALDT
jgi:hypothetical protein